MGKINFSGADLRRAAFKDCDLEACNFSGADLRGASWDGSVLDEKCKFEGAKGAPEFEEEETEEEEEETEDE